MLCPGSFNCVQRVPFDLHFNVMNRFEKTVFYFPNFANLKMAGHKMAIFAFLTVT